MSSSHSLPADPNQIFQQVTLLQQQLAKTQDELQKLQSQAQMAAYAQEFFYDAPSAKAVLELQVDRDTVRVIMSNSAAQLILKSLGRQTYDKLVSKLKEAWQTGETLIHEVDVEGELSTFAFPKLTTDNSLLVGAPVHVMMQLSFVHLSSQNNPVFNLVGVDQTAQRQLIKTEALVQAALEAAGDVMWSWNVPLNQLLISRGDITPKPEKVTRLPSESNLQLHLLKLDSPGLTTTEIDVDYKFQHKFTSLGRRESFEVNPRKRIRSGVRTEMIIPGSPTPSNTSGHSDEKRKMPTLHFSDAVPSINAPTEVHPMGKITRTRTQSDENMYSTLKSSNSGNSTSPDPMTIEPVATNPEVESWMEAWAPHIHPDDLPVVTSAISAHFRGDTDAIQVEHQLREENGYRWVLNRGKILERDTQGKPKHVVGLFTDIQLHKIATKRVQDSEKRLRDVLAFAPVCIFESDLTGAPLYATEHWSRLTGRPLEDATSENWMEALHPDDRPRAGDNWEEKVSDDPAKISSITYRYLKPSGEVTWVNGTSVLMTDSQDKPRGYLGAIIDISKQKQVELELEATNKQLSSALVKAEEAARARSEFVGITSHELRTPLNGILGYLTLLEDTKLTPEQKELVSTIRQCGDSLAAIISDVLDYSKIEAGRLELDLRPMDLKACIQGVLDVVMLSASERDVELQVLSDPNVPNYIVADSERLRQVCLNLVSNAVKFSRPNGKVWITVAIEPWTAPRLVIQDDFETERLKSGEDEKVKQTANYTHRVIVSVKDSGIGIPADRMDRLFKPFSQVEANISRRFGGTGLGLVISKSLVNRMGGEIQVQSVEHEGSTFTFDFGTTIPKQAPVVKTGGVAPSSYHDLASNYPLRILVAEDNSINQRLIIRLLGKLGYQADLAGNGSIATSMVKQNMQKIPYDVVLMDLAMPEMGGVEATRKIRSDPDIPTQFQPIIVALTANAQISDRDEALEAGMNSYLSKPLKLELLVDYLKAIGQVARLPADFKTKSDILNISLSGKDNQVLHFPKQVFDVDNHPSPMMLSPSFISLGSASTPGLSPTPSEMKD